MKALTIVNPKTLKSIEVDPVEGDIFYIVNQLYSHGNHTYYITTNFKTFEDAKAYTFANCFKHHKPYIEKLTYNADGFKKVTVVKYF